MLGPEVRRGNWRLSLLVLKGGGGGLAAARGVGGSRAVASKYLYTGEQFRYNGSELAAQRVAAQWSEDRVGVSSAGYELTSTIKGIGCTSDG